MRGQRLQTSYAKILAVGIGVSVLIHAAILGFGRFGFGPDQVSEAPLSVITLPEPDVPEEEALEAWSMSGEMNVDASAVVTNTPYMMEYEIVLTEAGSSDLARPLVPRPRITAEVIESGLTPIRAPRPTMATLGDRGTPTTGFIGGGGGVIIVGTGGFGPVDRCAPSGHGGRYPGRSPIGGRLERLGLGGRR